MATHPVVAEPRSRLTFAAISAYAEEIAVKHGVSGTPVDVQALVDLLGGRVVCDDRPESLAVRGVGDFTVFVPHHTSRLRDRFTLAHEVGHYFLHFRSPERYLLGGRVATFRHHGRSAAETQANVFASNMLMPAGPFTEALRSTGMNLVATAQNFEVSVPSARVRAEFLGYTL